MDLLNPGALVVGSRVPQEVARNGDRSASCEAGARHSTLCVIPSGRKNEGFSCPPSDNAELKRPGIVPALSLGNSSEPGRRKVWVLELHSISKRVNHWVSHSRSSVDAERITMCPGEAARITYLPKG